MIVNLEELSLVQSSITSLNGIQFLGKLLKVDLYSASKLEDIGDLRNNAETIRELRLDTCKNIKNLDVLSELSNLEKLAVVNCGEIPSLSFVKSLPKLKFLSFSKTNVIDGDLSYCV